LVTAESTLDWRGVGTLLVRQRRCRYCDREKHEKPQ